jgi:hypothetical protein
MADSLHSVRAALIRFYSALDDEKAQLLIMSPSGNRGSQSRRGRPVLIESNSHTPADAEQRSRCIEWADALKSWPAEQIASAASMSDFQRAMLYELMAAIYRSAGDLVQACPTIERAGPLSELAAKENQLRALRQDIQAIQPFAVAFENGLSLEQRNAVDATIGGPAEDTARSGSRRRPTKDRPRR